MSGEATQKLIERIAFIRHTHYGMFRRPGSSAGRPTAKEIDLIHPQVASGNSQQIWPKKTAPTLSWL